MVRTWCARGKRQRARTRPHPLRFPPPPPPPTSSTLCIPFSRLIGPSELFQGVQRLCCIIFYFSVWIRTTFGFTFLLISLDSRRHCRLFSFRHTAIPTIRYPFLLASGREVQVLYLVSQEIRAEDEDHSFLCCFCESSS